MSRPSSCSQGFLYEDCGECRVLVGNEELISVRDATRDMGRLVEAITSGKAEWFVLTRHGKMVAALVPIAHLEQIQSAADKGEAGA